MTGKTHMVSSCAIERGVGVQVAADSQGNAAQQLLMMAGVSGIPHSFIVDRVGKIQYSGHPMDPNFEHILEKVSAAVFTFLGVYM